MKKYNDYTQEFWTERRRLNLRENLDIIKGPRITELLYLFRESFFSNNDANFELIIMDGKNGEVKALCSINGIEKLAKDSTGFVLKIKFTMVRQKKDGQLHRKGYEYSIFDEVEIVEAEAIYITEIRRGCIKILEQN